MSVKVGKISGFDAKLNSLFFYLTSCRNRTFFTLAKTSLMCRILISQEISSELDKSVEKNPDELTVEDITEATHDGKVEFHDKHTFVQLFTGE